MLNTDIKQNIELGFEREADLVLACSQTEVDGERLRGILTNGPQTLDWQFVFRIAGRNGLLPLVGTNLLNNCHDLLDEEVRVDLSEFLRDHIRNNLLQTSKVVEISELLESAGIPVLSFKGPTLSIQAYGNMSLRDYVDLDMLVQPRHFDHAVEVLQAAGYVPVEKLTWMRRKGRFFTRKKDLGLMSEDKQVRIELHWKLSGTHFAMPVEIGRLWDRLETIDIGGKSLPSLTFSDLFVYLCLHGSRHGWQKFLWVCDINELIRKTEDSGAPIDWLAVRKHAHDHGCEKSLELGLFLINSFFGRRVAYPEIDRILSDKTYQKIAKFVRRNAFTNQDQSMEMGEWYTYHLSLKEKMSDRARMRMIYLGWYLKIAVKPNKMDEAVFKLPALFRPVYYLIRPLRLAFTRLGNRQI